MTAIDNLVHETSASTGTGNFTVSAVDGRQTFNDAFGTGGTDAFYYFISSRDNAEWEVGTGHLSDATTLVRDTVLASSNSGSLVNFSAGTSDVANDIPSIRRTTSADSAFIVNGRLTLETGVAISTTDQTAATSVFFTPYKGNSIGLYDGTNWIMHEFSEQTLSMSGWTTGKPNDIFFDYNGGSTTLARTEWTNDTTRATAIVLQDGIYVKSGDTQQRYLGTLYTSATGQSEDSRSNRFLWNYYNRATRPLRAIDTTNTWTYSTATFRQANASTANQSDVVIGVSEDTVDVSVYAFVSNGITTAVGASVGIGIDSTTVNSADITNRAAFNSVAFGNPSAKYCNFPGIGKHSFKWLELGAGSNTQTWRGDGGLTAGFNQQGLVGKIMG